MIIGLLVIGFAFALYFLSEIKTSLSSIELEARSIGDNLEEVNSKLECLNVYTTGMDDNLVAIKDKLEDIGNKE